MSFTAYFYSQPYIILQGVSLPRIFKLFRGLGLRHLLVVNNDNEIIGIVTRKDLAKFHSKSKGFSYVLSKKQLREF